MADDDSKIVVEPVVGVVEDVPLGVSTKKEFNAEKWTPSTELGKKVKSGQITSIDTILDNGLRIFEAEIVDFLVPDLQHDLLAIGQSKGKFGGGKKSIWRQTQKKTSEGNKPTFGAMVVIGNKNGYVGLGYGRAKETMPAREKALKNAKLNLMKVRRGCGSWECVCGEPHSIPVAVSSRSGSVVFELMPAPRGANLSVEKEFAKVLALAGVKDVYSHTYGQTRTKMNVLKSGFQALQKLSQIKIPVAYYKKGGVVEGAK